MAKFLHDDVLDTALDAVADNGNKMFVCSAQPATYTEASSTYCLATETLVTGDGNGDYTISNGASSGRKLVVTEQASLAVTGSDTATHVAICDSVNAKVLMVSTLTSQALVAGNTYTVPALTFTIPDPV